ncbi:MAG TPA: glucose 1-dehydrogenase [Vicinamibacterales bacterium]|nr:glucose 1-dehydrogenase [Vicinamibacterales bacterium]
MRAIVVKPELKDSVHVRDMPDPKMQPDHVAVKMRSVGLCGTDAEINEGRYGKAPDGDEFLILGHENLGVVEDVGKQVKGVKAGDLVVSTVRRPCGQCYNCLHRESDMCSSGLYDERGIIRRHGFMAEYYVESPQWLIKVPRAAEEIGVLLEPTAVVEKGLEQAFRLQERLKWRPKTGLVLGSGPVGLLAAAVLRLRGVDTYIAGREPDTDSRAQIATQMGATYICLADETLFGVRTELPPIDLAIEATGAASVAFSAMQILGRNGVLCLLSVTGGVQMASQPIDTINQQLVLGNRVVFGSVSANPRHFKMGVKDLAAMQKKWPGLLTQLITARLPWMDYKEWFGPHRSGIKTTLEITPCRAPVW